MTQRATDEQDLRDETNMKKLERVSVDNTTTVASIIALVLCSNGTGLRMELGSPR